MGNNSTLIKKPLPTIDYDGIDFKLQPIEITDETKNEIKSSYSLESTSKSIVAVDVSGVSYSHGPITFKNHWGILVDGVLFYLIFYIDEKTNKPIAVECSTHKSPSSMRFLKNKRVEYLGNTKFSTTQIFIVANTLIEHFGYYRVFWNCQHFSNSLLDVICEPGYNKIITSPVVPRKVLFGSILLKEKQKTFEIENKTFKDLDNECLDEYISASLPNIYNINTFQDETYIECRIM